MNARQVLTQGRDLALQMAAPADGVDVRVTNVALALMVDALIAQQVEAGIPVGIAEDLFAETLRMFRNANEEA